ncbi:MAG: hypothetical protein N5P05_003164 [Chroococcopsis gigantea SAG 12.99]|jgi:hypothetical protein|nr:hypothetical protein [Chroococcopsis gigantea SAG 12.99]
MSLGAINSANAQTRETVFAPNVSNIPELFNRAFNNNTGRFYELGSLSGQANNIFGWRTFPMGSFFDNMVSRDSQLVNTVYRDVMQQQTSGPLIRTRDLENPFSSSLSENPDYLSPGR